MTIEERAAKAADLKAAGACNCSQAVVKVFEDKLSLDDETLMKLTAGYAAGMGCLEATCGALIGAVMTAGVLTDGAGTPRYSKEILATVYKGNIIKNLIMDCQSYTKYRPNETTGGIFVSWRRKEELPTGA